MRSRRNLALVCAAPLVLTWMGCNNPTLRVARVSPPAAAQSASHTARMMQLAERYEEQGNREGALRLYRQIAAAEPGHSLAQARITAITGQVAPVEHERGMAVVSATRDTSRSVVDVPAPSPRAEPPTQPAHPPQPAAVAPREMPVAFESTERDIPATATQVAVAAPVDSSLTETTATWTASAASATADTAAWWEEAAGSQTESDANARQTSAVAVHEMVDSSPAWTRTSLVRLCPDADGELRAIVVRLEEDDAAARKEALMALSDLRGDAAPAAPAVRVLLGDSDGLIRAHAAWAAWRIGDIEGASATTLAELTQAENDDVVQVAAFFLGSMEAGGRGAVDALRVARTGASGITRLHLAEALIRIDPYDLSSLNELTRALQDPDARMRWLAAVALSGVSEEQASWVVPALTARLDDSDPTVCAAAALTLGSLGTAAATAIGPLERATTHDVPDVRLSAEAALACIQR